MATVTERSVHVNGIDLHLAEGPAAAVVGAGAAGVEAGDRDRAA